MTVIGKSGRRPSAEFRCEPPSGRSIISAARAAGRLCRRRRRGRVAARGARRSRARPGAPRLPKSPASRFAAVVGGVPAILVLSLLLGLFGIGFGLPNANRAYSFNPDEWTALQWLRNMEPAKLDFNPRSFEGPTLPVYLWGAAFGVAHVLGALRIDGTERYYFENPQDLALMLLIGRVSQVLFAAGTVWLVYLLGRRFGLSRGWSRLAALFMALHPSLVVHAHFMKVNPMVTFFCAATLLAADHWRRRGGARPALLAGVLAGLAASSKFSGVLVFPVLVAAGALRAVPVPGGRSAPVPSAPPGIALRELVLAFAAVLVVGVAGTPYAVLDAPNFLKWLGFYGGQVLSDEETRSTALSLPAAFLHSVRIHAAASTWPLLALSVPGVLLALRRLTPIRIFALLFGVVFFAAGLKAGHLATDSRFLPLFPLTVLFAVLALEALARRARAVAIAGALVVGGVLAFWTVALEARFVGPMPQEAASTWAERHLPPGARVALVGKGIYWHPDLLLREFLQADNADNYARKTSWDIAILETYAESRPSEPEYVFLTAWRPRNRDGLEWLDDPAYEVLEFFPGRVHVFGRRTPVWIDFYDIDTWVLRRRGAAGG